MIGIVLFASSFAHAADDRLSSGNSTSRSSQIMTAADAEKVSKDYQDATRYIMAQVRLDVTDGLNRVFETFEHLLNMPFCLGGDEDNPLILQEKKLSLTENPFRRVVEDRLVHFVSRERLGDFCRDKKFNYEIIVSLAEYLMMTYFKVDELTGPLDKIYQELREKIQDPENKFASLLSQIVPPTNNSYQAEQEWEKKVSDLKLGGLFEQMKTENQRIVEKFLEPLRQINHQKLFGVTEGDLLKASELLVKLPNKMPTEQEVVEFLESTGFTEEKAKRIYGAIFLLEDL